MNNAMNTAGAHALDEIVSALGLKLTSPTARTVASVPAAGNDPVFETGSRNNTLASLAGLMRCRGMTQEGIEAALLTTNVRQCSPPLSDDEVRGIARSISNYAPGTPNDVLRTLTEKANADRFARQWGRDVRYVPEFGKWLIWTGTHWLPDAVGTVMEMAKQTALAIYAEGDLQTDSDLRGKIAGHSKVSLQANKLEAMLKLAKTIPELVVPAAELDADPWVLGVENGTLDLRQGTLRPARREDYITKLAPVTFCPEARSPLFLKFLDEVMGSNQELVAYLQGVFGYMLTGDTSAQCLFFLYGTGANGKSTLLNIAKALLGNAFCRQTPSEMIMARPNKSGPTPELASLPGVRAVMTTEVEDRSLLAESLIKLMTGNDPIPARHMYGHPFEYVPSFKLFIAGNHKPVILGDDHGIWRRIHLIPFTVTIPAASRDPKLLEKLRGELSGILNWALEGCRLFQASGLNPPAAIVDAVTEYREDMDVFGSWVDECCNVREDLYTTAKHSFACFNIWLQTNGFRQWNRTSFGRKVQERFKRDRNAHGVVYRGFTLKDPFVHQVDGL
jgi:putative DNA primase/helicase